MHPKLRPIVYGLGVFAVYALLTYVLRFAFNRTPNDADFLGIYSTNDLLIGVVVAIVLTFNHERKKNIK